MNETTNQGPGRFRIDNKLVTLGTGATLIGLATWFWLRGRVGQKPMGAAYALEPGESTPDLP